MQIDIDTTIETDDGRRQDILSRDLGFGRYFTDRMFTMRFDEASGWHDPRVRRHEPFPMSPAAAVLHYGQAIFEGQKAYYRADGEIGMFRPEMNASRFMASCERMVIPTFPEEMYLTALETLVDLERAWVPRGELQSLYVRPFAFATEPLQGVRPAREYMFAIILSPVGAYYASGFKPVKILVSEAYTRAAPGGTGSVKAAGNYGASLAASREAAAAGCAQVMWLDAAEHRCIEEIGAMNVMFVVDGELITAPLDGTILPGVTRDSVLTLARDQGMTVSERTFTIDELIDAIKAERCSESFGCGTAAVITSIGSFRYRDQEYELPAAPGPVAQKMLDTLTGIQWGRIPDERGWVHIIPRRNT